MSYIPSLISLGLQTIFLWLFKKWKKMQKNAGSLGTIETNRIGSERVKWRIEWQEFSASCQRHIDNLRSNWGGASSWSLWDGRGRHHNPAKKTLQSNIPVTFSHQNIKKSDIVRPSRTLIQSYTRVLGRLGAREWTEVLGRPWWNTISSSS